MDYQLHLEWKEPADIDGSGQLRGNSGVFLASTGPGDDGYEVQILIVITTPLIQMARQLQCINKESHWRMPVKNLVNGRLMISSGLHHVLTHQET